MAEHSFNDFINLLAPVSRNILGQSALNQSRPSIPIDIVNEENLITIYAEVPGVDKDKIVIDFFNNELTIIIDKSKPYTVSEVCEIKLGKFKRTITLPICVTKKETVNVSCENGVLKIKINKMLEEENKFSIAL